EAEAAGVAEAAGALGFFGVLLLAEFGLLAHAAELRGFLEDFGRVAVVAVAASLASAAARPAPSAGVGGAFLGLLDGEGVLARLWVGVEDRDLVVGVLLDGVLDLVDASEVDL